MNRFLFILLSALFLSTATQAQTSSNSDYYGTQTSRLSYGYKTFPSKYYGFRVGLNMTHIASDDDEHSCGRRSRLNIGFVYGRGLSKSAPIYIETGLAYIAKGGKKTLDGRKMDYNLDYLELPFVLKYRYSSGSGIALHVFFGGYFSCGIGGSIKRFKLSDDPDSENVSYSSFSDRDESFRRFDAGLKFGLGVSYEIFYLEFAYDLGLANINHDPFLAAHNRNAVFNLGINF